MIGKKIRICHAADELHAICLCYALAASFNEYIHHAHTIYYNSMIYILITTIVRKPSKAKRCDFKTHSLKRSRDAAFPPLPLAKYQAAESLTAAAAAANIHDVFLQVCHVMVKVSSACARCVCRFAPQLFASALGSHIF